MRARACGLHGQAHVFDHAQIREQVGELKRPPQARQRALGNTQTRQLAAIQRDAARRRFDLPRNQIEIGRFARTVGPDDGRQRARLKRATDRIDGHVAAEPDCEVFGLQHGQRQEPKKAGAA